MTPIEKLREQIKRERAAAELTDVPDAIRRILDREEKLLDLAERVERMSVSYNSITIIKHAARAVIEELAKGVGEIVLSTWAWSNGKTELERKGAVEALRDIFGGTTTDKGYKVLDSHIGLIYGDAITLKRCEEICERLMAKGFASTNCVYGIGSYTYQYNTRDTFGFALKSTLAKINGDEKLIFKDPKTDNGIKKSQKGKVVVIKDGDTLTFKDGLFLSDTVENDLLKTVYLNGKLVNKQKFSDIRERLKKS